MFLFYIEALVGIKTQQFSFQKIYLRMLSGKCWQFVPAWMCYHTTCVYVPFQPCSAQLLE